MSERTALRLILPILAVLLSLGFAPRTRAGVNAGLVPGDYCNARGERRTPWTSEAKERTRARVDAVTTALEVAPIIAAFHRLVVCREAFCGESSVRHTLGADAAGPEDGLGAYGLSLRWHRDKWPGDDEDPALCTVEASAVVVHEIVWRAVTRYGASNLVEVQSVYAGAVECRDGTCRFTLAPWRRRRLCERARAYGYSCWERIGERDLGVRLSDNERRAWALAQARASLSSWLGRAADLGDTIM